MAIGADRLPASFRGVPFLVEAESEIFGKKHDPHEFPGADFRYVEELGRLPSVYNVTAVVSGLDATLRRNALKRVCLQPGPGLLVHPAAGSVQVTCVEAEVSSANTSLGEYIFELTFLETRGSASLIPSALSVSSIALAASGARTLIQNLVSTNFSTGVSTFNDSSAALKIQDIVTDTLTALRVGTASTTVLSQVETAFNDLSDDAFTIVGSASTVAARLGAAFDATVPLFADPGDGFAPWLSLTTFGADDAVVTTTTFEREQRENNRRLLNYYVVTVSTINAIEAAASRDYATATEINQATADITDAYALAAQSADARMFATSTEFESLATIYQQTVDLLDQQLVSTPRVRSVESALSSPALITYLYYGNIDQERTIANLNPEKNHSGEVGPYNVLTE